MYRPINPIRQWNKNNEKLVSTYIDVIKNNFIYVRGENANKYKGGKFKVIYTPAKPLNYLYTDDNRTMS